MKKRLLSLAVVFALVAASAAPALAHGSHRRVSSATRYAVCTVQDCAYTGLHTHSGKYYNSHYYGDGHDYHDYCGIADCTLTGYHEHNGTYCFGHTAYDGHSYHHTGGRGHH